MINFVCWKWKAKPNPWKCFNQYTAEHVNVLYSMIERNMRDPFRLVCLTDDPTGIRHGIDILPVWNDFEDLGGCYRRLKLFKREMRELIGEQIVSIDLDCAILQDITPLFRDLPDFKIMKATRKNLYCGCLFAIRAGAHPKVWRGFRPKKVIRRENRCHLYKGCPWFGTDQAVIAHLLPNAPTWHWNDGVYNFREIFLPNKKDLLVWKRLGERHTGTLPRNARIIFFNGKFDPSQPELQEKYPWIRKYWK